MVFQTTIVKNMSRISGWAIIALSAPKAITALLTRGASAESGNFQSVWGTSNRGAFYIPVFFSASYLHTAQTRVCVSRVKMRHRSFRIRSKLGMHNSRNDVCASRREYPHEPPRKGARRKCKGTRKEEVLRWSKEVMVSVDEPAFWVVTLKKSL